MNHSDVATWMTTVLQVSGTERIEFETWLDKYLEDWEDLCDNSLITAYEIYETIKEQEKESSN
jgi:hypothetical protein